MRCSLRRRGAAASQLRAWRGVSSVPEAGRRLTRGPNARQAARVYGANTLGAIAGALAASFVMIPWLGVHDSLRAGAIVTLIAAGLRSPAVRCVSDSV